MAKQSGIQPSFHGPVPINGFFFPSKTLDASAQTVRANSNEAWAALGTYSSIVWLFGEADAEWHTFERELAPQFAELLVALRACERREARMSILKQFLDRLALPCKRGRPRRPEEQLSHILHGRHMNELLSREVYPAWNMKESLQHEGTNVREEMLKRKIREDVVDAVLSRRSTRDSALVRVYSQRYHVSRGRARNALRSYRKWNSKMIAARE
jgi:hypothetical protein